MERDLTKKILEDLTAEEIEALLAPLALPKFRAGQIFKWVQKAERPENMSDLPAPLKEYLSANFAPVLTIEKELTARDGTKKFLYALSDGELIEGVLMEYKYGYTLCVSTQVGCDMRCAFCASGRDGARRNLSAGEILGQVTAVNKLLGGGLGEERKITNVVLMGSGEPLDNYGNVTKFLRLINDKNGLNISPRNISLSTCGIAPAIKRLADEGYNVMLTISLHAGEDAARSEIMPVNKAYPLNKVMDAARYFFKKTGRRVIFEYVLIKGKNHFEKDAEALRTLLTGLSCHINLILLNPVAGSGLKSLTREEAGEFARILTEKGLSVTVRRQMGADIDGACGQLKSRFLKENGG